MLLTLGEYFAARVTDLDDIRNRTVAVLLDVPPPGIPELKEPSILVAMDLAPADTALIDKSMVLAFATQEGGPTSHTSILARNLGIPAVVGCPGVRELAPGTRVLVDGSSGKVVVDPPDDMVEQLAGADEKRRAALAAVGNAPGTTSDGHEVPLLANIGGAGDVEKALENGAEGVGLFRSELLFLDRNDAPSEEEQYGLYRAVLEGFAGKKVVVRTLDAGADKPLPFLPFGEEPNPAMGVRGLRICMQAPEIMRHPAARARAGGQGLGHRALGDGADDRRRLRGDVVQGGLQEGRAARPRSARWSRSPRLRCAPSTSARSRTSSPSGQTTSRSTRSPLIARSDRWRGSRTPGSRPSSTWSRRPPRAANANGIPTGVCGEAAADPALACVLVGLGVNTLSMSSGALPGVRAALAAHTLDDCKAAADAAINAVDAAEAKAVARQALPHLAELGL